MIKLHIHSSTFVEVVNERDEVLETISLLNNFTECEITPIQKNNIHHIIKAGQGIGVYEIVNTKEDVIDIRLGGLYEI